MDDDESDADRCQDLYDFLAGTGRGPYGLLLETILQKNDQWWTEHNRFFPWLFPINTNDIAVSDKTAYPNIDEVAERFIEYIDTLNLSKSENDTIRILRACDSLSQLGRLDLKDRVKKKVSEKIGRSFGFWRLKRKLGIA